eukprot:gene36822-64369_t
MGVLAWLGRSHSPCGEEDVLPSLVDRSLRDDDDAANRQLKGTLIPVYAGLGLLSAAVAVCVSPFRIAEVWIVLTTATIIFIDWQQAAVRLWGLMTVLLDAALWGAIATMVTWLAIERAESAAAFGLY